MKVTSQVDASKQRFAVLASTKRTFVSQVSSQMVSSLDIGHKVMKDLMAKMLENPDVTEKVDLYKLRDEILKKIKSEGESKDEDKDSNDKGKDKGRQKVAKDQKKATGKKKDAKHEEGEKKDTKHGKKGER